MVGVQFVAISSFYGIKERERRGPRKRCKCRFRRCGTGLVRLGTGQARVPFVYIRSLPGLDV
jgi:hypothetical protein